MSSLSLGTGASQNEGMPEVQGYMGIVVGLSVSLKGSIQSFRLRRSFGYLLLTSLFFDPSSSP